MMPTTSLARNAQKALRRAPTATFQRRSYAVASSSGAFETSDASGIKIAARDAHGPTTRLAVVSKAGTRYSPLPGLTVGLEEFAFKNTHRRSALRITREAELLGGQLTATHTREGLVLEAAFLRDDLPYFTELLGEVVSMTRYTTHEYHEDVERVLHLKQASYNANVALVALDNAHAVAFHEGLGNPLYPIPSTPYSKYLDEERIASYAGYAYAKENIAIVGEGAAPEALGKWVEQFFTEVPALEKQNALTSPASKYYGGEQRLSHTGGNSMAIAFPGSDLAGSNPEVTVLAALLGGQSTIKWSPGYSLLSQKTAKIPSLRVSAANLAYSDAGLLTIQLSGPAASVRQGAIATVESLLSVAKGEVSKETVAKAIANAKFELLDQSNLSQSLIQLAGTGVLQTGKPFDASALAKAVESFTAEKLQTTAKTLLAGKASVAAVGDLFLLPFAEQIGLKV